MGLAGPKNRFKISKDPNNTTWSRNTDRFGHRILTAQGWKPGSHLGSQTSEHAAHHTAASFSHVRVLLKDDNLGLGAKRGSERAENFGMAGFDDLLARLNGKSEEKIQEVKSKRRDADMKVFVSQRWGTMMFVSGGFLVGDQIVKSKDGRIPSGGGQVGDVVDASKPRKESSKKRKHSEETALETIDEDQERKLKRKKRKSNLRVELEQVTSEPEAKTDKKKSKKTKDSQSDERSKKSKSNKRRQSRSSSDSESDSSRKHSKSDPSTKPAQETESTLKAARKAEKAALKAAAKADKAARKEAKRLKKSKSTSTLPTPADTASSSASPAPAVEGTAPVSNAIPNTARHAARRKYIMAKRSAIMDPQALKEIFMIKGTG
ncbi:hypothetical protein EJ05DRAFT_499674 [Pseudovirgaria hyperparasitica]|uniref:PinX1-related protein 1 n=1 Tax=Pseudovirgaria hyperparasitica TaxID=470096 RepID=A0A6A6WBC2_9PEZI|nr:uncharacterized protein EJ05DRAFT_499674 [Pseudovirgaria hyperparasitica]KAF2759260.1 hypothetical protein EJ05DRAFT_499674 [Pseudovirgaria hyperparasitica]